MITDLEHMREDDRERPEEVREDIFRSEEKKSSSDPRSRQEAIYIDIEIIGKINQPDDPHHRNREKVCKRKDFSHHKMACRKLQTDLMRDQIHGICDDRRDEKVVKKWVNDMNLKIIFHIRQDILS